VECVADVPAPDPLLVIDEADICSSPLVTWLSDVSDGNSCPEIITRTYSVSDNCGNEIFVTQQITVNDITDPVVDCPVAGFTIAADFNENFATYSIPSFAYSDNCTAIPNIIISWVLSGATSNSGTGLIPEPYQFIVGTTTVDYIFEDACGNQTPCSFTVTVTSAPEIECALAVTYDTDPGVCTATKNSGNYGLPTLLTGVQPVTWTWTITNADGITVGATGTFIGSTGTPGPPAIPDYPFELGTSTITWRAENISGFDECTQDITVEDHEPPTFTPPTYTDCVDMLNSAVYNPTNPNPNSGVDPNLVIVPSPDYSTLISGDTALDLTDLDDNCCDPADLIINWRIDFTNVPDPLNPSGPALSHPSISGTGQPSTYGADILLWGDGVNFVNVAHTITYWVEDCHNNMSAEQTGAIVITPRPQIIKMN
jgi:hypothetical protein